MIRLLCIAIGGAMGAVFRAMFAEIGVSLPSALPYSTLLINAIGSLIIGLLWGVLNYIEVSSNMRSFVFIGILGGFTTFSAFSLDVFNMFESGNIKSALRYIAYTNIVCIALVFAGFFAATYAIPLFLRK